MGIRKSEFVSKTQILFIREMKKKNSKYKFLFIEIAVSYEEKHLITLFSIKGILEFFTDLLNVK